MPAFSGNANIFLGYALYIAGIAVFSGFALGRVVTIAAGVATGSILQGVFQPNLNVTDGSFDSLWKYGIAGAVTVMIVYLASLMRSPWFVSAFGLTAVAVLSLFLNFRSHALASLAAAALVVVFQSAAGRRGGQSLLLTAGSLILAGGLLVGFLPTLLSDGYFGAAVQSKMQSQNGSSVFLIFAGRTETPLSLAAISAHPFLGWGELNHIDGQTLDAGAKLALAFGLTPSQYLPLWIRPDGSISLHSMFFTTWAESGILGVAVLVWAAMLFATFWRRDFGRWFPLAAVLSMQMLWDLFFSPWSAQQVVNLALATVLVLSASQTRLRGSVVLPEGSTVPTRIGLAIQRARHQPGNAT